MRQLTSCRALYPKVCITSLPIDICGHRKTSSGYGSRLQCPACCMTTYGTSKTNFEEHQHVAPENAAHATIPPLVGTCSKCRHSNEPPLVLRAIVQLTPSELQAHFGVPTVDRLLASSPEPTASSLPVLGVTSVEGE